MGGGCVRPDTEEKELTPAWEVLALSLKYWRYR
jgi:hypothetical protein